MGSLEAELSTALKLTGNDDSAHKGSHHGDGTDELTCHHVPSGLVAFVKPIAIG